MISCTFGFRIESAATRKDRDLRVAIRDPRVASCDSEFKYRNSEFGYRNSELCLGDSESRHGVASCVLRFMSYELRFAFRVVAHTIAPGRDRGGDAKSYPAPS